MTKAIISPTLYVLDERRSLNWSSNQEKAISPAYPFDFHHSGPEDYVLRTYLQFLWLPDSLMPLTHLVPSLKRVNPPSGSSSTADHHHPMHALLEPLLHTTRSVSKKYHSELLQILANGGGAGEMEEAMMWYAVEHEKLLDDEALPLGNGVLKHGEDGSEGLWSNENWRKMYLERMERREVQIQILLYFFKLSLPGPQQQTFVELDDTGKSTSSKKRKRAEPTEPIPTIDDHLESFMDKLAMWQLIERIDHAFHPSVDSSKDERHWTQIFVADIVEQQFKCELPHSCKLLRSKVFPTSPFSDAESDAPTTREASPEPSPSKSPTTKYVPTGVPLKKSLSRTASISLSRAPSLASSLSRHIPPTSPARSTSTSVVSSGVLVRSRSRSLSVSLAQEQEEKAAAAAAAAEQQSKKRGRLNREVSMSRVKGKGKGKNRGANMHKDETTVKIEAPKVENHRQDKGITLVEETPVKARVSSTLARTESGPVASINFGSTNIQTSGRSLTTFSSSALDDDDEEEEEWMVDSSPHVVVFDPGPGREKANATVQDEVEGGDEEWNKKSCGDAKVKSTRVRPLKKRPRKR